MILALSTHWNAFRHASGEALLAEIIDAGFSRVELGYDLRLDQVPGVRALVEQHAVAVGSVHNFCPVPIGAPQGHPELFELSSLDRRVRESAVRHTERTIEFAASVGAPTVVAHAGNVDVWNRTRKLVRLYEQGRQFDARYERIKLRLLTRREKKAARHLDALRASIDALLPLLRNAKVRLAFENLPSWESIPTEAEMEALLKQFDCPHLGYWHDLGHGQVRQNLGFSTHRHWLEKLGPWLAGIHIHDVAPPADDHLMPPAGTLNFSSFRPLLKEGIPLVVEPVPGTPVDRIREGCRLIEEAWQLRQPGPSPAGSTPP